jgi:hypothetical protein
MTWAAWMLCGALLMVVAGMVAYSLIYHDGHLLGLSAFVALGWGMGYGFYRGIKEGL